LARDIPPASRQREPGQFHRPAPSALAQAALEDDLAGKVQALGTDPGDRLAAALARLGRAFTACDLVSFTGMQQMQRNLP